MIICIMNYAVYNILDCRRGCLPPGPRSFQRQHSSNSTATTTTTTTNADHVSSSTNNIRSGGGGSSTNITTGSANNGKRNIRFSSVETDIISPYSNITSTANSTSSGLNGGGGSVSRYTDIDYLVASTLCIASGSTKDEQMENAYLELSNKVDSLEATLSSSSNKSRII